MALDMDQIKQRAQVRKGSGGGDGRFFIANGPTGIGNSNPVIGTIASLNEKINSSSKPCVGLVNFVFGNNNKVYNNIVENDPEGKKIKYFINAKMLCISVNWPNDMELYAGQQVMVEFLGRKKSKNKNEKGEYNTYIAAECRDLTADGCYQEIGEEDFLEGTPGKGQRGEEE